MAVEAVADRGISIALDHTCYKTENGRAILSADPIKNGRIIFS